jgi:ankyrin repeat protein
MSALAASSEFVDSAACGDLDGVRTCLADPTFPAASINAIDKDGRSAFHYGCLNDDVPLLTILFADPRVDKCLRTPRGDSPLHLASLYASLEAMKLLFSDSCDLNAQNDYGETALHLAAGSGDKGAVNSVNLLLGAGASLVVLDKWGRGPCDVSYDNSENPLVEVFKKHLGANPDVAAAVADVTKRYREESSKPVYTDTANVAAKAAILGALGGGGNGLNKGGLLGGIAGLKLKKTTTNHKSMFGDTEGKITANGSGKDAASDGRRALSKLIDFPGNLEEITAHLNDAANIDPAGKDFYGLPALHKFASWNKTEYMNILIPKLTAEELSMQDRDGKTALHWAVEMAAVAAVKLLVEKGINVDSKDAKGFSVKDVLSKAGESGVIDRLKKAVGME